MESETLAIVKLAHGSRLRLETLQCSQAVEGGAVFDGDSLEPG